MKRFFEAINIIHWNYLERIIREEIFSRKIIGWALILGGFLSFLWGMYLFTKTNLPNWFLIGIIPFGIFAHIKYQKQTKEDLF